MRKLSFKIGNKSVSKYSENIGSTLNVEGTTRIYKNTPHCNTVDCIGRGINTDYLSEFDLADYSAGLKMSPEYEWVVKEVVIYKNIEYYALFPNGYTLFPNYRLYLRADLVVLNERNEKNIMPW